MSSQSKPAIRLADTGPRPKLVDADKMMLLVSLYCYLSPQEQESLLGMAQSMLRMRHEKG